MDIKTTLLNNVNKEIVPLFHIIKNPYNQTELQN